MRILLVALALGLVGAFAGVAVPWLGSAADGARNCVFIIFANVQLVGLCVRVRAPCLPPLVVISWQPALLPTISSALPTVGAVFMDGCGSHGTWQPMPSSMKG